MWVNFSESINIKLIKSLEGQDVDVVLTLTSSGNFFLNQTHLDLVGRSCELKQLFTFFKKKFLVCGCNIIQNKALHWVNILVFFVILLLIKIFSSICLLIKNFYNVIMRT